MHTEITRLSKRLRRVYERQASKIELPHFSHFPKNSCQLASLYLGVLINRQFPTVYIELIHGRHRLKEENHYWLEVSGFSYDITADQFDDINEPIYAGLSNPLSTHFSPYHSTEVMQAFSEYQQVEGERSLSILAQFEALLSQASPPS
ncbi:hypothetical protein [Shewanella nanhaiensis]|uniref:Uncharacterized protein n=1 Tax=Shewanella nanhaiensis TaxID=2864872 RepID=A0ABS7E7N3_9GAMM|nr:hypothetical protein [Shewanella nanhaiensis]MBW8185599.1 hypothetical protein [Shewanella nanhaiensis]